VFKSVFLGLAANRKRTIKDEDITQELFLDSDSDAHTSENALLTNESDSDHDKDKTQPENIMHWLEKGTLWRYLVCSVRKKQSRTIYVCPKCSVTYVMLCFKICHAHSKF